MSEFNLLDEKWILVRDKGGKTKEVSLIEVFEEADDIISLANETPTLDAAILRLLLAVMHASLAREVLDYEAAIRLWVELWEKGLPVEKIRNYLEEWRDRFYLFDDEYPFYQVAAIEKGTEYGVPKLLGTISESGNKVRQFPLRVGEGKLNITYGEAARWLLHVNGFDDTSGKPTKTEDGSKRLTPGAGWLGKIGLVFALGNTLRETLILNFILVDRDGNPWEKESTSWELEKQRESERTLIPFPRSQAKLLTLQSRRLLLKREGADIVGFILLGGDFFPRENAFCEQMTLWRKQDEKEYVPKRHDASKQLWRDFQSLTSMEQKESLQPGLIQWLNDLTINDAIGDQQIKLSTAFVEFADKDFYVIDSGSDVLSFNAALLSEAGIKWTARIYELLHTTDEAVSILGRLATDLSEACGDKRDSYGRLSATMRGKRKATMAEAYYRLDEPFRSWLASIDPKIDNIETQLGEWYVTAYKRLKELGEELVEQAGTTAFIGVVQSGESGKSPVNAPIVFNKFSYRLRKLLKKGEVSAYEE